jgi:hypothetical protein
LHSKSPAPVDGAIALHQSLDLLNSGHDLTGGGVCQSQWTALTRQVLAVGGIVLETQLDTRLTTIFGGFFTVTMGSAPRVRQTPK